MSPEQTQGIIEYIPTKEEKNQLREYMTRSDVNSAEAFDQLCECEKFMVAMMTVRYSKQKVRALLFKQQCLQCIEDIQNGKSYNYYYYYCTCLDSCPNLK